MHKQIPVVSLMLSGDNTNEQNVWLTINPDDIWVMDKLILSRKLGYVCGPTGQEVPKPDYYIVRPCVNMLGLGLGTRVEYLENNTDHLPLGFFWCEIFEGRHLSVDYSYGIQILTVEGFKDSDTFTNWSKWIKVEDTITCPEFLENYPYVNCEFIGNNLIEVHYRHNPDFKNDISEFIPVWEGQDTTPPEGYSYIDYPDVHGRIGAFVK